MRGWGSVSTPLPFPYLHPFIPNPLPTICLVSQSLELTALAALPAPPLGPTPPSRALSTHLSEGGQTAVRRYETQLQPTQVRVVSQTAEGTRNGRDSTHPSRGNHEAELAGFNRQHRKASQSHLGFASPHVKALVGEVMMVDDCMGNDTHQLFCQICRNHQWSYYIDVQGEELGFAHLARAAACLCSLRTQLLCSHARCCLGPPDPCNHTSTRIAKAQLRCHSWSVCNDLSALLQGMVLRYRCGVGCSSVGTARREQARVFAALQQLFRGMQSWQGLLRFGSTSQGSAQQGYETLMACPLPAKP